MRNNWQTLSDDPNDPMKRKMKFDDVEKKLVVRTEQDNIQDILAMNKAWKNAERKSSALWNGSDYVKVASIPLEVIEQWHKEGINFYRQSDEDKARISMKLNDSEYSHLRTAPGRI